MHVRESNMQPISNTRQRIAYVLKRFPRFSETFILNELLELQRQGADVEVFSLLHPPEEPRHSALAELEFPVTYLGKKDIPGIAWGMDANHAMSPTGLAQRLNRNDLPARLCRGKDAPTVELLKRQAVALAGLAWAGGITHFHAHFASNATTVAALAGQLVDIPYSFTAHARDIYHRYVSPEVDDAIRAAKVQGSAFTATVSQYNTEHLQALPGVASAKIRRLYNGIDLCRFSPATAITRRPHILAVGRLVEKKGFTDLVHACRQLQMGQVKFRCSIVGEGPLKETLQAQIDLAGLHNHVKLVGPMPQERLIAALADSRVVVLPCVVTDSGDRDGLPTVLLEAMAMGLPTVSTAVAGVPEIIDHGVTGMLAQPNQPQQLAQHIRLLLQERQLAQRMGLAARKKAVREFNLATNVARLNSWFEAAALSHRSSRPCT